jgi:hypothetical protein
MAALREAQGEHAQEIRREGALLDPDAALDGPVAPAGDYLCRTIKLGGQNEALPDWAVYPQYRCRIRESGGRLTFARLGGSQRPVGSLYPGGMRRMIFLGSMAVGDERQALPYSGDADRDMAGILERIGDNRWRLVFPRPTFESIIDVVELVPVS